MQQQVVSWLCLNRRPAAGEMDVSSTHIQSPSRYVVCPNVYSGSPILSSDGEKSGRKRERLHKHLRLTRLVELVYSVRRILICVTWNAITHFNPWGAELTWPAGEHVAHASNKASDMTAAGGRCHAKREHPVSCYGCCGRTGGSREIRHICVAYFCNRIHIRDVMIAA